MARQIKQKLNMNQPLLNAQTNNNVNVIVIIM